MSGLVVITRDLMDASRFRAAVPGVAVVRSAEAPEVASARTVVLDLASGVDPAAVVAAGPPVVAYGSHVDRAALDAAIAVGCVEAIPRSQVFRRMAEFGRFTD